MPRERDFVTGVVQLANLLLRRFAPVVEKANITPQQWLVLSTIAGEDEPISLVTLARRLVVSKQNMTGMVARLEAAGLIRRRENPGDLRSHHVELTRRGRGLVTRLQPAYREWLNGLGGSAVSASQLDLISRAVAQLIELQEEPEKS